MVPPTLFARAATALFSRSAVQVSGLGPRETVQEQVRGARRRSRARAWGVGAVAGADSRAAAQLNVGVGALAGSSIMLLTLPWAVRAALRAERAPCMPAPPPPLPVLLLLRPLTRGRRLLPSSGGATLIR